MGLAGLSQLPVRWRCECRGVESAGSVGHFLGVALKGTPMGNYPVLKGQSSDIQVRVKMGETQDGEPRNGRPLLPE